MPSIMEKPFYFRPPWNILFELHKLQKIMPWDVNISFLLTSFLVEMEKRGEIDFRASGTALDTSATIYLMKTKLLLKLEEPPPPPKPPPDFLPPPMYLPYRFELSSTTIDHLLNALDEVLTSEISIPPQRLLYPIPPTPEVLPPIDLHIIEIEDQMKALYDFLKKTASESKLVMLSKIIAGLGKLEAVKKFIVILFLAQRGKVNLWQKSDFEEIYITISGDQTVGKKGTGIF